MFPSRCAVTGEGHDCVGLIGTVITGVHACRGESVVYTRGLGIQRGILH